MAKRDYYEVLGVAKGAGAADLKAAYRKQAMKFHPDRNPDDPEAERKFKEVNEAYDVLKDDEKRAAYDRFGHAAFEGPGAGGAGARGFSGEFNFGSGFADLLDELFGDYMGRRGGRGAGGGRRAGRGADLRYAMEITLEEAFAGKQASLRVPSSVKCDSCGGSGAEKGSSTVNCSTCGGDGRVRAQQGFFTVERTCPACQGAGQVIEKPCKGCSGSGRQQKERQLSVNIPAGVEDGTQIRLSGEGEAGLRGAASGDLYISLSVRPHAFFRREGADISCTVPITMVDAALGGAIEVPTIDGGRAKINLPPGTQNQQTFRLRGKGMSVMRSSARGDMYIDIHVETPVNLSPRQQELLREFEAEGGAKRSHSPQSAGFFSKVKEFWEDLTDR
ncbi:MAG: molecular chaperone DnaJ [Alphaproteobacteria bacterium]